jgi:hypothetical protein
MYNEKIAPATKQKVIQSGDLKMKNITAEHNIINAVDIFVTYYCAQSTNPRIITPAVAALKPKNANFI